MRIGLACVSLTACRNDCETRVKGGSPEDAASVDAAVHTFRDLLAPDLEICVPSVRIVDELAGAKVGVYNPVTHRVRVQVPTDLVVYHELCHAVHHQNRDLRVDGPHWELAPDYDYLGHLGRRGEAVAVACADGPNLAYLLGTACPYDPPGIDVLFDAREWFVGPDAVVDIEREGWFTPTIAIPTIGTTFDLQLTDSGLRLTVDGQDRFVDPWTAADLASEAAAPLAFTDDAATGNVGLLLKEIEAPNGAVTTRRVFVEAGPPVPAGARYRAQFVPLGCVRPEERVFAWDDWMWSAWLDEGAVTVGYWTVR